ncbi:hypothetical protein D047_1778A, partial [Vibrio parahaemolyticus VPTS-2010_2]
MTPPVRRLS